MAVMPTMSGAQIFQIICINFQALKSSLYEDIITASIF